MPLIAGRRGVSLLELILAVALVTVAIAGFLLVLPKATRSAHFTQEQTEASNWATSKIQEFSGEPYSVVPLTVSGAWFSAQSPNNPGCDCTTASFPLLSAAGVLGSSDVVNSANTTYQRVWCINQIDRVGGIWNPRCPPPVVADTGVKRIIVQVIWQDGTESKSVSMDTIVTRS